MLLLLFGGFGTDTTPAPGSAEPVRMAVDAVDAGAIRVDAELRI